MDKELIGYYWLDLMLPAIGTTVYILFFSMLIDVAVGFFLAILLYVTDEDGMYPHHKVHMVLNTIVNTIRSIPAVIMIILLLPLARMILGTAIGTNAAIVYISVMSCAFVARIFEEKLRAVDKSVIRAGRSMGLSKRQILFRVVVHEAIPSMVLGTSFATIMIMGNIAFAGMVGAGGIGAVAMQNGYASYNEYVMYNCILLMFVLTLFFQITGRIIYNRLK